MEDSCNQSAALIIGSNEDLLTEILIRLSVTSIIRFKSVCKHWQLLLSDSHFTHRYDNNNLSKSRGLFACTRFTDLTFPYNVVLKSIYVPFDVENRSTPPFASLNFYFNRSYVRIIHSCNGLLLCFTFHNGAGEYSVFNPATKQLAFIPSILGGKKALTTIRSMDLAFHHTQCVHYKVVCIRSIERHGDSIQVQVYSSDTRTWKICIESFSERQPYFRSSVYWNGAIHWALYFGNRGTKFLCYKLDIEQLQRLPVPEGLAPERLFSDEVLMYFGESRDHLLLISYTGREEDILLMNLYEMLRDHSGWYVKYRLQLDEVIGAFPNMVDQYGYNFEVVDVVRGKEEEETFLVLVNSGEIIRYNVHDKSFKELYSDIQQYCRFESVHRYIEILSSF